MRQTITLFAILSMAFLTCVAQPRTTMRFAGPSTFGVAAMNAWQDNETDTILFMMTSGTEADITLPSLTYNALNYTIPSFTIHGATFTFDMTTHNAVFSEQKFSETLIVDGEEKVASGTLTATYAGAARQFTLEVVMSYGRMPLPVTYRITADYVSPSTAIEAVGDAVSSASNSAYDLSGRRITGATKGLIIVDGKKVLVR